MGAPRLQQASLTLCAKEFFTQTAERGSRQCPREAACAVEGSGSRWAEPLLAARGASLAWGSVAPDQRSAELQEQGTQAVMRNACCHAWRSRNTAQLCPGPDTYAQVTSTCPACEKAS